MPGNAIPRNNAQYAPDPIDWNGNPSRAERFAQVQLLGHRAECGVLDRLIEAAARDGTGRWWCMDEPGVGKTALLYYLARADGSDGPGHRPGC